MKLPSGQERKVPAFKDSKVTRPETRRLQGSPVGGSETTDSGRLVLLVLGAPLTQERDLVALLFWAGGSWKTWAEKAISAFPPISFWFKT